MIEGAGIEWVRLESTDKSETLDLLSEDSNLGPYNITKFDVGYPSVREVSRYSPFMDGDTDTTTLHGPRVISIEFDVYGDDEKGPNWWAREFRKWGHPTDRHWIAFMPTGYPEPVRVQVRCDSIAQDWDVNRPSFHSVSSLWKAPSGRIESYNERQVIILPEAAHIGRTYPLVFPRQYENIGPISGAFINNNGSARANLVIRLYGPMTGPAIYNDHKVDFNGNPAGYVFKSDFQILDGDFVEIRSAERKILLNGLPQQSVIHQLDFETSSWWNLSRGFNQLRLSTQSYSSPAQAQINWHCTYI
jgi:hypothetical protein